MRNMRFGAWLKEEMQAPYSHSIVPGGLLV